MIFKRLDIDKIFSRRGKVIAMLSFLVVFSGLLSEEHSIGSLWKESEKEERAEQELKEKDSVCAISFSSFVEKASGDDGVSEFHFLKIFEILPSRWFLGAFLLREVDLISQPLLSKGNKVALFLMYRALLL